MSRFFQWFPWAAAVLLAALLVTVSLQKRDINRFVAEHRRADQVAQPGDYVPTFAGVGTNGETITVGRTNSEDARQVVFLLTAECQFCRRTLPSWTAIAEALATSRSPAVQVIALTTDSLPVARAFADSLELRFPLVPFPERKLVALTRARIVPQTLVLNSEGRVLYSRRGELNTRAAVDSVVAAARRSSPASRGQVQASQ